MAELLRLESLRAGYGEAVVLDGIDLQIEEGGSLALLGRNGVGKTSLLVTLMGLTRQHGGSMRWRGMDFSGLPVHRRARAGLGWVPQERLVYPSLTVEEHLTAVARRGPWTLQRVYDVFPRLKERRKNGGLQLSGGEQQMLAIGMALGRRPRYLVLDEPTQGLAPAVFDILVDVFATLKASGLGLLLAEQNLSFAARTADRYMVLSHGEVTRAGGKEDLSNPEQLAEAFLV